MTLWDYDDDTATLDNALFWVLFGYLFVRFIYTSGGLLDIAVWFGICGLHFAASMWLRRYHDKQDERKLRL